VLSGDAHVLLRRCTRRMRCSLGVLPEWKRLVVDCPLLLVSILYVVEYFFDGQFWLPKLCRRTSVYLRHVLGVTGHELRSTLAKFCGLDRRGDGRLLGCSRSSGMCLLFILTVADDLMMAK
jgi:hypothetical protein